MNPIDLQALRVFCKVIENQGFSRAAKALGVTQPMVSQQISRLEMRLGTKLFQRVGKRVVPTAQAQELLQFATGILDQMSAFEERIQNHRVSPQGVVRYAMPESCQWTPHFRKIMAQMPKFPEVQFRIGILPNDAITESLLEGSLDFGFVLGERLAPELRFEKFSDERYSAVASDRALLGPLSDPTKIAELRLVAFPGWEMFFTAWSRGASLSTSARARLPEPVVRIGTLAGAIHAVQEGVGAAIIPTHCIFDELRDGRLKELKKGSGAGSNPIYLARRVGEKPPRRVELVLEMLREAKRELG